MSQEPERAEGGEDPREEPDASGARPRTTGSAWDWLPSPVVVVCLLLVVMGVVLRVQALGAPDALTFDEHHFVENARNYLQGKDDWNDHPPLGKLTIAASLYLLGDSSFAWRLPGLIAGISILLCGAALARRLFPGRLAPWVAMGLLSADGFLIAYSRTGLIDGQLVALAMGAILLVALRPRVWTFIVAGLLAGLATNIKISGVATLGPIAFALWLAPFSARRRGMAIGGVGLAYALGFLFPWWLGLTLTGETADVWTALSETRRLALQHASATKMDHPLTSSWPTWLVALKPLVITRSGSRDAVRLATTLGNPFTWYVTSLAVVGSLGGVAWYGVRHTVAQRRAHATPEGTGLWSTHGFGILLLLVGWLSFLSPWVLTRRDPYIYHYLPCYALGVILLAGIVSWVAERRKRLALIFLLVALDVGAFYSPVWSRIPLTQEGLEARLWMRSWR